MTTSPKIITFYSYKGGVGRTMALANVAWLLSKKYNVLVVDWDLEAPGLHKFFGISEKNIKKGLIDLFYDYKELLRDKDFTSESDLPNIDLYIKSVYINYQGNQISILPAGNLDKDYATKVNLFDWDDFYKIWYGYGFIEYLKKQFKNQADFILIDSKTGVTDVGGICTLQIPDAVVLLFCLNEQSIQGTERIIKSINKSKSISNKEPPKLFIIPSRVEKYLEKDRLNEWSEKAAQILGQFIDNDFYEDVTEYIKETLIPHLPYYTFGEELAVKIDPNDDMAKAYKNLEKMILKEFHYEPLKNKGTIIDDLTVNKTDDYELWITKGFFFSQSGEFDKAIKSFDEALKMKPDNAEIWFNKGTSLFSLGRAEEALISYDQAIDLKPSYTQAWLSKGIVLNSLNIKIEALNIFERVITLKADCAQAWLNKGSVLSSLSRWTEALEAYEKAIDIKPDYVQAWFNKGITLTSLGREEEALKAYNHLASLSSEVIESEGITELNISERQINKLPSEISKLKYLFKLNISKNKLSTLPHEIVMLRNLTALNISENQLISLPPEIFELKNLTQLYISGNQLTSLPPEISELRNLTELNISENQLTFLPSEIFKLKNLTALNISGNQLKILPPEISKLRYLTELNVSGNQFKSLPPEISELRNLTELNISENQLTFLPSEIFELKNLTALNISGNQLAILPPEISELRNLTALNISENQLTSLPSEIFELKNLTALNISGNQLTILPPEISKLRYLTALNVSGNQLTSLPPEILELDLSIEWENKWKSNTIYLKGNPFKNPPVEIVKFGREAVINYFKSLKDEKKPLNEIKVLLVGEGGAGKTSLVKRIFGEEVDGNESQTQGINIRKWIVENRECEIKANFWDFGGQEIMHATHQFFFSKRSLYILVLDGRKDEKPEYWLKLIENFGGDSPVLVVINKIDENPAFELNRKFLREKYPFIRGFHRLSCKSDEGIKEFSKTLEEELKAVKHLEIKWPKSWFNVKSKLEKICSNCTSDFANEDECEHCNFIQYNDYKIMCDEEGISSESEQNTLVDFLHDLGVILHFRDIPLLNTHVLEPEWVTNAVYKLVNSGEIAESRGVLKLDMFAEILKQRTTRDFRYPPDQYGFFISLMKKFELSYDIDDSTVLLPGLLEIQEPDFEFDYEGTLRFIIDYDFLPPSVMPRFIVKMNRDIKDDLRWRTGVVLEDKGYHSTAVVRADIEAKRISIYVNGEQKRDYFSVILQRFREINNSFEKLKATEKIPLPDETEVTVSYDHLIKLELKGRETYMPDGSDNEYKVSDLLGTVINRSSERALLEEMLRITEMNRNREQDILQILRKLQEIYEESDNENTLLEKIDSLVSVNPNFFNEGLNLGEIVKLYLKQKRRQS